jgi:hypothetical protein
MDDRAKLSLLAKALLFGFAKAHKETPFDLRIPSNRRYYPLFNASARGVLNVLSQRTALVVW